MVKIDISNIRQLYWVLTDLYLQKTWNYSPWEINLQLKRQTKKFSNLRFRDETHCIYVSSSLLFCSSLFFNWEPSSFGILWWFVRPTTLNHRFLQKNRLREVEKRSQPRQRLCNYVTLNKADLWLEMRDNNNWGENEWYFMKYIRIGYPSSFCNYFKRSSRQVSYEGEVPVRGNFCMNLS